MSNSWIQLSYDLDCRLSDWFAGPLDLLLHLVRRHQLDLRELPLSILTEKYLEEIERARQYNIDVASEFLVLAATLVEWKCRFVLPGPETTDLSNEQTEVRDFFLRLMEQERNRAAAAWLSEHLVMDRVIYRRGFVAEVIEPEPAVLRRQDPDALAATWGLLEQKAARAATFHGVDERSLRAHTAQVLQVLYAERSIGLRRLLTEHFEFCPALVVVTFLALLELARCATITLDQTTSGGEILITLTPEYADHGSLPLVEPAS
jgi:segregation and condensation protein A